MMQYRGAPWKDPEKIDSSGRLKWGDPPEFFTRYMRLTKLPASEAASLSSTGGASTNFLQCEANPGVTASYPEFVCLSCAFETVFES